MERRKALAVAAMGSLMAASAVVSAASGMLRSPSPAAATSGVAAEEPNAPPSTSTSVAPIVVTETRDIFDRIVVPTAPPPAATAALASSGTAGTRSDEPVVSPDTDDEPVATTSPTTAPTSGTTQPPGVPDDWPDDRPIPPMPSDCEKPQLEDDGTWNCDH